MQSGESIYALIPPPEVAEERPPMHRSQHVGAVDPRDFGMPPKRANATMGRVPGALKPKTERFLRSGTRDAANVGAANSNGPSTRAKTKTKPAVPKAHERPSTWEMTGLHSDKDFVTANALECILAKPEKPAPPKLATEKAEYGKVPAYLETIKAQIAAERTMLAERRRAEEEAALGSVREMTEEERDDLLFDLKTKWGKLNAAYGRLSFSLDVPSHRRKKESLEREMTQLEKDVKQLQGRQVVVLEDGR